MTQLSKERLARILNKAIYDGDDLVVELVEEVNKLRDANSAITSKYTRHKNGWVRLQQQMEASIWSLRDKIKELTK